MKKIMSVMCAGALAMSMAVPAFAAEGDPAFSGVESDKTPDITKNSNTVDGVTNITGGSFTLEGGDALAPSTNDDGETVWENAGKVEFTLSDAEYTYTYNESGDPDNPGDEVTGTAPMTVDSVEVKEIADSAVATAIDTMITNKNTIDSGLNADEMAALKTAMTDNGAINLQVTVSGDTESTATQDAAGHVNMSFTINYNPTKFDGTTATAFYVMQNEDGENVLYSVRVNVNPTDGTMTFAIPDVNITTGGVGRAAVAGQPLNLTIVPGAAVTANQPSTTPDEPVNPDDPTVNPDDPTVNPDVPSDSDNSVDKADVDKASEKGADTGETSPKTGISA